MNSFAALVVRVAWIRSARYRGWWFSGQSAALAWCWLIVLWLPTQAVSSPRASAPYESSSRSTCRTIPSSAYSRGTSGTYARSFSPSCIALHRALSYLLPPVPHRARKHGRINYDLVTKGSLLYQNFEMLPNQSPGQIEHTRTMRRRTTQRTAR